jgi:hypothetical protein
MTTPMYYKTLEGRRRQIYDAWENGVGHFPTSRRRKSAHLLLQRQQTGFATRVTALRASVSQGGARQFSARPGEKITFINLEFTSMASLPPRYHDYQNKMILKVPMNVESCVYK